MVVNLLARRQVFGRTEIDSLLQSGCSTRILQCWIGGNPRKRIIDPKLPHANVSYPVSDSIGIRVRDAPNASIFNVKSDVVHFNT